MPRKYFISVGKLEQARAAHLAAIACILSGFAERSAGSATTFPVHAAIDLGDGLQTWDAASGLFTLPVRDRVIVYQPARKRGKYLSLFLRVGDGTPNTTFISDAATPLSQFEAEHWAAALKNLGGPKYNAAEIMLRPKQARTHSIDEDDAALTEYDGRWVVEYPPLEGDDDDAWYLADGGTGVSNPLQARPFASKAEAKKGAKDYPRFDNHQKGRAVYIKGNPKPRYIVVYPCSGGTKGMHAFLKLTRKGKATTVSRQEQATEFKTLDKASEAKVKYLTLYKSRKAQVWKI